jgi:predicted permease
METLWQDIRYGVRLLAKNPGFALIAILTIALAIGANTAVFSVLDAVLLRSLPVADPAHMVVLTDPDSHGRSFGTEEGERSLLAYSEFQFLRDHNDVFSGIFAADSSVRQPVVNIGGSTPGAGQQMETAQVRLVSGAYFSTLGVQPAMGRAFTPEMDRARGGSPYAVISYAYWKQRFGLDPAILGNTIRIRDTTFEIIGVGPPGFFGETVGDAPDIWLPITMQDAIYPGTDLLRAATGVESEYTWLQVIARLKPGVTLEQANAGINVTFRQQIDQALGTQVTADFRRGAYEQRIKLQPGARGASTLRFDFGNPLKLLMALVGLVLLIACANLANLLLARASARQKEFAVRLAIGSGRLRLIRQLLTESFLLAFLGAAAGYLLSIWAGPLLVRLASSGAPGSVPIQLDLVPDIRVLGFTLGATLLTVLLFGLLPAIRSARVDSLPVLRAASAAGRLDSERRLPAGRILVVVQVAVSVILLSAAGLFLRSLQQLQHVDLGYNRENILMFRVDAAPGGYKGDARVAFHRNLLEKIRALPGVQSAVLSSNGLFQGSESADPITVEGYTPKSGEELHSRMDHVGPGYFSSLGIPILSGREIQEQDAAPSRRVAVINRSFAETYFPNTNPLGKIVADTFPGNPGDAVIVGVVADSKSLSLRQQPQPRIYFPFFNEVWEHSSAGYAVRTLADPELVSREIRSAVAETNPALPSLQIRALTSLVAGSINSDVFVAQLSAVLALLALVLAAIGLYGLMAYTVSRRTREIGIRMALGARPEMVRWQVMRETLLLVGVGVALGVPAAIGLARLVRTLLFGVGVSDPVAIGGAMFVLAASALLAASVPARRASRVDPMIALRYE